MNEDSPKVVSLLEWLVARAPQRGEPVEPNVKRLVLGVLDEVVERLVTSD